MSYSVIVDHGVGYWVASKAAVSHYDPSLSQAVGLVRDNALTAGVIYTDYNGKSIICHIAIDGGVTADFMNKICDYPFNQCGVKKIIGPVDSSNEKCIRFVKKVGFKEEARIKDAHPSGDVILFTMVKEDCRYLKERYGKKRNATGNS